jgi:aminoglycoside 6'-N-acetyltransferase I
VSRSASRVQAVDTSPGLHLISAPGPGEPQLKTRYGLEIRACTSADAAGISELLSASGHTISPRAIADRLEAVRSQPGTALLAAEWGPPSGLVLLHWYRTLDADQFTAQITMLLVGANERRRGIGRLLVKAAAQAARVAGCGKLELLVAPEEPALRMFCQATGFVEAGQCFVRPLRKKA